MRDWNRGEHSRSDGDEERHHNQCGRDRHGEFCCGGKIFAGDDEGNDSTERSAGNAEGHGEDHGDGGRNDDAGDHDAPARIWRQFALQELREPPSEALIFRRRNCSGGHIYFGTGARESPRMTTTADSLRRKRSFGSASMRTRTGKRDARCTQLSVRCTSGSPCTKRPTISASGVTPKPMLSTTPWKRMVGRDRT